MKEVFWNTYKVTKSMRREKTGHRSFVIWMTGLSGSGKSTLAAALESILYQRNLNTYVLDGDNVRHGLNHNLGFSDEDRKENIRRVGEVAKILVDAGIITIVALISPFREDRDSVRKLFNDDEFLELYVECSLDVCEQRDVKGLYKKAKTGEIKQFTGISSPYEPPLRPELTIATHQLSVEQSLNLILNYLEKQNVI